MRDLGKMLKREIKSREEYKAQRAALIEKVIKSGGLEMVKMYNGEIVAVDKDRTFYSIIDSVDFFESMSKRENVD
jgi:aspartate/methionine/tyrosine aminotransferase